MKRIALISLGVTCLLVIVTGIALRSYLRSRKVADQVTSRLQTLYGGPVQIDDVDIGLGGTSLGGIALYEEGSDVKGATPWLKVKSLTTDISLWELINDEAMPKHVTLTGATLLLRFDRAGNLLTRLPAPPAPEEGPTPELKEQLDAVPETEIKESNLIFRKDGHPDLIVKNVSAKLTNAAGKLVLVGTADNAEAGKLNLAGVREKDADLATVHIKTQTKVHVTQAVLDRVPFVPAIVWDEIQVESGESTAELTVSYELNTKAFHYQLDLAPENTRALIPSLGLTAHNVSGKVVILDNVVQMKNFKAQGFGGTLTGEADLDFRGPIDKLRFPKIKVENLNLAELPESWNIPAIIRNTAAHGKLFGDASLVVTILPANLSPASISTLAALTGTSASFGSGPWFPAVMLLATTPAHQVLIQSQGKGQVRDPAGKSEPIEFDWQLAPKRTRTLANPKQTSRLSIPTDFGDRLVQQPVLQAGSSTFDPAAAAMNVQRLLTTLLLSESALFFQEAPGPKEKAKKQAPLDKEAKTPKYLDMNLNLKHVSLAELIKNLEVKLPFPVEGKISFQIKASIPVEGTTDLKAYKVQGSVEITQLLMAGMKFEELSADINYSDGLLSLKSLKGRAAAENDGQKAAGGILQGSGQVQLFPLGELRADLHLDRLPISQFSFLEHDKVQGTFSGDFKLRSSGAKLESVDALEAEGTIESDHLKIYGLSLEKVSGAMNLKMGILKIASLQANLEGTPLSATGELRLRDDYPYFVKLDVRDWKLASLQKYAVLQKIPSFVLSGGFTTDLAVEGKLDPFLFVALGNARIRDLKLESFEAQDIKFHWETDGKKLDLKDLDATLYGGQTTGTAVVPFEAKKLGNVDLTIRALDVKQLAKDLRVPFRIEGKVDGSLKGTFLPTESDQARTASFHIELKAPKLRVQNIPTDKLHGNLEYKKGVVDYKLAGETLGGTFDLEGQIPGKDQPAVKQKDVKQGKLILRNIHLGRLFDALNTQNAKSIGGVVNLDVKFKHDLLTGSPEGEGELRISNFRWKNMVLADNILGDVILSNHQFSIRNLSGSLADGTFDAKLTYYLRDPNRSSFSVKLDRVDSAKLLGPWLEGKLTGLLQARIRGNLGSTWRGTAELDLTRAKVYGLSVEQLHVPVTWSYAPSQGRAQLDVYETTAQVSRGRATGRISLTWDYAARVEGFVRLDRVDVQDLLKQTIGPSQLGGGQLTGRFDFAGSQVRSLNDLSGAVVASFNQAQALQLPVLSQLAPFLGVGTNTTFQQGDLRARLNGGTLRIQRLSLKGNNVKAFIDGDVTLTNRLNLAVIARTGDVGLPSISLGPVALRVPPVGPVPLVVLAEASSLLSRQVISLQVTGTLQSPVIRPRPLPLLSQEALRYFLYQSNLPVIPNQ